MSSKQNFHNEQMRDSKIDVLNQLKNREMRNKLLHYQIPRLNGTQKGIKIFGESQIFNKDCVSGGSNITYSSNLNNNDYEKYRKQILQTRVDSLQAMKAPEGMAVPQQVELSQDEGDKLAADSALDAILTELSTDGLASNSLVYKYIKNLVKNIYFYDTNDFIKLLNIFDNFDDIIQHFQQQYEIEDDKKKVRQTKLDRETFENITNYIKENMKGVNLDVNKRKILSKSTIKYLRLNNLEKALKRNKEGRQILQDIIDEDEFKKWQKFTDKAAAEPETPLPTPPSTPFATPSPSRPPSPLLLPPPTRPPTKSSTRRFREFIVQKSLEAGITDENHIRDIVRIAKNYFRINRVLTENELENLIQNYINNMGLNTDLSELD